MYSELLTALALVLVIEGLLPAISPAAYKRTVAQLAMLADGSIRNVGLGLMLFGVVMLYIVH